MPESIQFIRSVPRWALVRALSGRFPSLATGTLSCIRKADMPPPRLPTPEWVRVQPRLTGICGSDLSTIACKGSPYFSPFVSMPFVLGHELVGDILEVGADVPSGFKTGSRVVLEPALGCEVRGIKPACRPCALGHYAHCENVRKGSIEAGVQTGFCASTGGGWSHATLVAHYSQIHFIPAALSDEEAVLAEPLTCALHAALKAPRDKDKTMLVIGCGAIGLLFIHAYRLAGGRAKILAVARFPHQADMAKKLGADIVAGLMRPQKFYPWVLEQGGDGAATGGVYQPELGKPVVLGGVDITVDCVGASSTMDDALRLTRPRGLMILVGMPGIPKDVDWTSGWYKEVQVQCAYAYGREDLPEGRQVKTMELAVEFLEKSQGALKPLVSHKFALRDYRAAIENAFRTDRPNNFKTVFDLRS